MDNEEFKYDMPGDDSDDLEDQQDAIAEQMEDQVA